jgi:hypothetical protein
MGAAWARYAMCESVFVGLHGTGPDLAQGTCLGLAARVMFGSCRFGLAFNGANEALYKTC